jgi:hypothetical protein
VNRLDLQQLAQLRLEDAQVLLAGGRWAAAYYLTGYAVECGLKACLLRHLGDSASVFGEIGYLKRLADCWTHDRDKLVGLAGLKTDLRTACGANPALNGYWGVTKDWQETSRYQQKTEAQAKALYEAVTQPPDGVYLWIQARW